MIMGSSVEQGDELQTSYIVCEKDDRNTSQNTKFIALGVLFIASDKSSQLEYSGIEHFTIKFYVSC